MIKIENKKDLEALQEMKIRPLIIRYISNYFERLTKENNCEDIIELGAIYLLEDVEDSKNYKELGLSKPIKKSFPEFTELITIKNSIDSIKVLHSCFVISNSYAISVFAQVGTLEKSTENYLLDDSIAQVINYN